MPESSNGEGEKVLFRLCDGLVPALGLLLSNLGLLQAAPTNLFLSAVLLVLLAFFYRLSLVPLGDLLQQREKEILQVVTKEVE